MTMYADRMTMLSVRVDDDVVAKVDSWCSEHDIARSDFLREAVRRELNRRHSIDEAERIRSTRDGDDDIAETAFDAVQAWAAQEDWSQWHAWLDARDAALAVDDAVAVRDSPGADDDQAR